MVVTYKMFRAELLAVQYHDHDKILQPSKAHVQHDYPIIAELFFFEKISATMHKSSKYVINIPLLFVAPTEPTGVPLMNFQWYLTLGNINNGGMIFAATFMVHARVNK